MVKVGGYKALLLAGVSTTVLVGGLSVAQAQIAIYSPGATPPNPLVSAFPSTLPDPGNVNAATYQNNTTTTITAGTVGNSVSVTAPNAGVNSYSVTSNAITSTGTGNLFTGATSSGIINTTLAGDQGGIATALLQTNISTGAPMTVSSQVTDSTTGATLTTFTIGTAVVNSNRDQAETDLNKSLNTIEGQVPNAYTSPTLGAITYVPGNGTTLTTQGSLALGNNQLNISAGPGGGSGSLAAGNAIGLSINNLDTVTESVTASPTVNGNTISALFQGNTTDNSVLLHGGTSPTFQGSIALSNNQFNQDSGTTNLAAGAEGNTIGATLGNTASANLQTLVGSLTVSGNTISSTATGNNALTNSSTGTTGNVITLDSGLNFVGSSALATPTNTTTYGSSIGNSTVNADLSLFSIQLNGTAPVGALTVGNVIFTGVTDMSLGGGTVAMTGNSISSQANGNQAFNSISNGVLTGAGALTTPVAASFSGTTALGNVQANYASPISATTVENAVFAEIAPEGGGIIGGSVSVSSNTIQSLAFGNQATNSIQLQATDLDPVGLASLTNIAGATLAATAGTTITNSQFQDAASPVSAATEGVSVGISAGNTTSAPPQISTSTLAVNGNNIQALASGSNGSSALTLLATTMAGSAGVANTQTNNAVISAETTGAGAILSLDATPGTGGPINSTLSVDNNTFRAIANGNNATNSVTATVDTINSLGAGTNSIVLGTNSATTTGGVLALQNSQSLGGNVTAATPGNFAILDATDTDVVSSTLSVTGNGFTAGAVGNIATNSLTLNLNAPTTGVNSNGPSLALTSLQQVTGAPTVSATVEGIGAGTPMNSALSSTVSVNNNSSTAVAIINDVTNTVTASASATLGTSDTTLPLGVPATATSGATGGGNTTYTVSADVSLNNVQTATGTATAFNSTGSSGSPEFGLGLSVATTVGSSTLSVSGNQVASQANGNIAGNTLNLTATSLSATGAILNSQTSSAAVTATSFSQLGLQVGDAVTASTITANSNATTASATGNSASNVLNASAASLYGMPTQTITGTGVQVQTGVGDIGTAGYVVLNGQNNSGAVTATASSTGNAGGTTNLGIALNGTVAGSTVSASGNQISANATGNTALNQVTVSALPSGSPSIAVGSNQVNTGPINASVNGGSITVAVAGLSSGSSYNLTGNTISSSATGNSATNIISTAGQVFSRLGH